MALKLTNNAASTLASNITDSQTNIPLASGHGARWPTLGVGDWCPTTIVKADGTREIVRVTGRTGDMLTVTRGEEGTTGVAFTTGDKIELRLTAAATEALVEATAFQAALATKADIVHTHAQADITGLTAALAAKIGTGRLINTSGLAGGGGDMSADRTITVMKSTGAEVVIGTEDGKATTPKAIADAKALGFFMPIGTILEGAFYQAPTACKFCDGSNVSRTTYAALLAAISPAFTVTTTFLSAGLTAVSVDLQNLGLEGCVIEGAGIPGGTTVTAITATTMTMSAAATASGSLVAVRIFPWGRGDGTTSFNLPDLRGVALAGRDNMGGVAASRLTNAGTGNPGMKGSQLGFRGGVEKHTLTTPQLAAHTHGLDMESGVQGGGSASRVGDGGGSDIQTASAGGGEAHPNVQPTSMVNYVIFCGVA